MTTQEFLNIKNLLRVYPGCCKDQTDTNAWYETLRNYDYKLIDDAVRRYLQTNKYTPTPAAIIELIPKPTKDDGFKPRFETLPDGRTVPVISCRRCNDTGLITYYDKEGRIYGKPCECQAGHSNYHWGWLTEDEQKEFLRKNGKHGEVVGESWYPEWEQSDGEVFKPSQTRQNPF